MSVSDIDTLIEGLALFNEIYPCKNGAAILFGARFRNYWSPMHCAFHDGNFEFIEVMIRSSYDFNSIMFKWFPFRICIESRCVEENNVLHYAAHAGHTDIVKLLLKFAEEKKIDINALN